MIVNPYLKRIAASGTTTILSTSCLVRQITISCADAGTGWTLKIQDRRSDFPFVLIPAFTLTVPTDGNPNVQLTFQDPLPMEGGIDIITVGTPGEVAIWLILMTN